MDASLGRLLATLALFCGLVTATPAADKMAPDERGIADLARVWGQVAFLHPRLAGAEQQVENLLHRTLAEWETAVDERQRAATLNSMLESLGDHVSGVVEADAAGADISFAVQYWRDTNGGLWVNLQPTRQHAAAEASWRKLADELKAARRVVFDLRTPKRLPASATYVLNAAFQTYGINDALYDADLPQPRQRTVVWRGFPNGHNNYTYKFGEHLERRPPLRIGGKRKVPALFLCDRHSLLPPIAAAMQEAKAAAVFSLGSACLRGQVQVNTVPLAGGWTAEVASSEPVSSDGKPAGAPTAVFDEGAQLTAAAESWLRVASAFPDKVPGLPPAPEIAASQTKPSARDQHLAGLVQAWNIIRHFHPSIHAFQAKWDALLPESVTAFARAETAIDFAREFEKLMAHVPDGHVWIQSKPLGDHYGRGWLPFDLVEAEKRIVIARIAVPADRIDGSVRAGDEIVALNGQPIRAALDALRPQIAAGTPQHLMHRLLERVQRGQLGATASLSIRDRGGVVRSIRAPYLAPGEFKAQEERPSIRWLAKDILYADLGTLQTTEVEPLFTQLAGARAVVFDLRTYPRHSGAWWFVARLGNKRLPLAFAKLDTPIVGGPLHPQSPDRSRDVFVQHLLPVPGARYSGGVYALIDEGTISAGEHMGLKLRAAADAVFIGRPTAGADGDVTNFCVAYRTCASFSGADVYWPDGRPLNGVGIIPDVAVPRTLHGVRAGADDILERALQRAKNDLAKERKRPAR